MSGQSAILAPGSQQRMVTLAELRVFDLKQELEKRGLDKNGIKFTLIERLETALRNEGHDPSTFRFTVGDYGKNASTTKSLCLKRGGGEEAKEFIGEGGENEIVEKTEQKEVDTGVESNVEDESVRSKDDENSLKIDIKEEELKSCIAEVSSRFPDEKTESTEGLEGETLFCESESKVISDNIDEQSKSVFDTEEVRTNTVKTEEIGLRKDNNSAAATVIPASSAGSSEKPSSSHLSSSQSILKRPLDTSLWIRGIGPNTKAADLQALFSKYGRVITAKIYTRRQQPSGACFGFVTMVNSDAADLCIHKLNRTTVKGRVISIERADRSSMSFLKSVKKKAAAAAAAANIAQKNLLAANTEKPKSEERSKTNSELVTDKEKKEKSSGKSKGSTATVEKSSSSHSWSDKQKHLKTTSSSSSSKKVAVRAPSSSTSQYKSRQSIRERTAASRMSSKFKAGRRIAERAERFTSLRRPFASRIRKPIAMSVRRPGISTSERISPSSRMSRISRFARREVSSRRVEPSWDKREVMEVLRKKEEEHRLKEQELRLQRERERLRFERERIERERLELQQWRQMGQFAASQMPPMITMSRRSDETYDDIHSSSHHRSSGSGSYARSGSDRHSSGHRSGSSSTRVASSERHEPHVSSRYVSSSHHSSSRSISDRDRSRHGRELESRSYTSSSPREYYSRDFYSVYGRSMEGSAGSYGKDSYRGADVSYSSGMHRSGGSYGGSSSRSGGSSSWRVSGGGSSGYMGSSSRDYEAGSTWMSSMASQSQGMSGSQWQSSRTMDNWLDGDGYSQQGSHNSSYEKSYDKCDSYDKYGGRRY
uniref:Scaffold attachment factor B1 n=1 Tax=Syphacia muris TaxID=451379 RepID=A0A0N5AH57_9BILA